jgi:hypothetical protein
MMLGSLSGLVAAAAGNATLIAGRANAASATPAHDGTKDHFFGEPLRLRGRNIYFTSWKYVCPGRVGWHDGAFTPHRMPMGVRLMAQESVEHVPCSTSYCHLLVDRKYKKWGSPGGGSVSYAESDDGLTWKEARTVFSDPKHREVLWAAVTVFVDPSAPDSERYKMIYVGNPTEQEWDLFGKKYAGERNTITWSHEPQNRMALYGAVSPNGMDWIALQEPLLMQPVDTHNTCYYDVDRREYVAYVRAWEVPEQVEKWLEKDPGSWESWSNVGRRVIGRSVSKDFRHFSPPEIVMSTGADMPPSHVWYTNAKTTLPDCPDQHVMFAWLWEMEQDGGDVHLLSSSDGRAWARVPGGPVLRRGAPGSRAGGYVNCQINLSEYGGDRWGIPHIRVPTPHKYSPPAAGKPIYTGPGPEFAIAMWPKGRLVALQADEHGAFSTIAVVPPGRRIQLNASVGLTGHIKVSAAKVGQPQSMPGRSFAEADPIAGDGFSLPVTWNGESEIDHGGDAVILHFQLQRAKLFGIEFV